MDIKLTTDANNTVAIGQLELLLESYWTVRDGSPKM